jgi:hypothetical protein
MNIIWKKNQNQAPLQNLLKTFLTLKCPFQMTTQEEFIFEEINPLEQT